MIFLRILENGVLTVVVRHTCNLWSHLKVEFSLGVVVDYVPTHPQKSQGQITFQMSFGHATAATVFKHCALCSSWNLTSHVLNATFKAFFFFVFPIGVNYFFNKSPFVFVMLAAHRPLERHWCTDCNGSRIARGLFATDGWRARVLNIL